MDTQLIFKPFACCIYIINQIKTKTKQLNTFTFYNVCVLFIVPFGSSHSQGYYIPYPVLNYIKIFSTNFRKVCVVKHRKINL